jgi:hypothetical protein
MGVSRLSTGYGPRGLFHLYLSRFKLKRRPILGGIGITMLSCPLSCSRYHEEQWFSSLLCRHKLKQHMGHQGWKNWRKPMESVNFGFVDLVSLDRIQSTGPVNQSKFGLKSGIGWNLMGYRFLQHCQTPLHPSVTLENILYNLYEDC